jgi:arylsulfatase
LGSTQIALAGKHTLEFEFIYDGLGMGTFAYSNLSGVGKPGRGIMRVGKEVTRKKVEKTIPITLAWDESQDIGSDTETPVDDNDYQVPFTFNGKILKITLDINRPQLGHQEISRGTTESPRRSIGNGCFSAFGRTRT